LLYLFICFGVFK